MSRNYQIENIQYNLEPVKLSSKLLQVLAVKLDEIDREHNRVRNAERDRFNAELQIPTTELPLEDRAKIAELHDLKKRVRELETDLTLRYHTISGNDFVLRQQSVAELNERHNAERAEHLRIEAIYDAKRKAVRDLARKLADVQIKAIKAQVDSALIAELEGI